MSVLLIQCIHMFLLLISFSSNTFSVPLEQIGHQQNSELVPQGLYNASDMVEVLTVNNFNRKIYGSNRSWLVEFYNTWCGHCQRYAPTYKAVANYFKNCKDIFIVAAVDCSNDINQQLCRNFEIMGYPTLRYFHENYVEGPGNLGLNVLRDGAENVDGNIKIVLNTLQLEQKNNRAKMLPYLHAYEHSDISKIFDKAKQEVQFAFLVLEDDDTMLGIEAALTFHKVPNIFITYSQKSNNVLARSLNFNEFPSLIIIRGGATKPVVEESFQKIHNVKEYIINFLKRKDINVDTYLSYNEKDLKNVQDNNKTKTLIEQDIIKKVKAMGDVVFQMDLETTLRFLLGREVSRNKVIEGEKLLALRDLLKVLTKYFPLSKKGILFLNDLSSKLTNTDSIRGAEISVLIKNSEREGQLIWSSPKQWLGCKGSTAGHRGYPCGVWTMFHYLTVNAADYNKGRRQVNPKEILMAMHGYIKNFFGCAECSQHFQKMAAERKIEQVSSLNESVLWLWKAHNEVNERLAGDLTEDPAYPKRQFPTVERCPPCRYNNGSWNENEVEKYIKHMYSSINIRYMSSDTKILHMGLEDSSYNSSRVLDSIDSSMLLILYFSSFLLLIILVRMFLKRGYRKKPYVHDLLGKV
ncbi:hypothetical protein WA026_020125 [Henosepilachna vigintioctopunctata]|uniref:Sulfhydryl oxidase n=1 Tax=Henosepilachna vigintioctopunctata TaxID=420089 RepID=A0AAW1UB93_9CUCU